MSRPFLPVAEWRSTNMAEWIEVPAHRIYVISERELRDDFDYIGENGDARRATKFPTVSYERRTAKFLGGPASLRNIPEFMSALRSKRYDSCNWTPTAILMAFQEGDPYESTIIFLARRNHIHHHRLTASV
jgi:hypothetical protein